MEIDQELFNRLPKNIIFKINKYNKYFDDECLRIFGTIISNEFYLCGDIFAYKCLSQMIDKKFTVIDLGCHTNPQSYYFVGHKKYIAVDHSKIPKFCPLNCETIEANIEDFLASNKFKELCLSEVFIICIHVPLGRYIIENSGVVFPHIYIDCPS
jgi:hypothetical protein